MNSCSPLRHAPPGRRRRDDAAGLRQPPVSRDAPRIFLPNLTKSLAISRNLSQSLAISRNLSQSLVNSRKLLYERSCLYTHPTAPKKLLM